MKMQILKTALSIVMGASLTACGDGSRGKNRSMSGLESKDQEKEFTGEPASLEVMMNQTYRLKTDKQEFVLNKLGQMVWSKLECKAEITQDRYHKQGTVTVSFYPAFEVVATSGNKTKNLITPDSICGRTLSAEQTGLGLLERNEANYLHLQYGLAGMETPLLTMVWDELNATPGEITCTAEDGEVSKATIIECVTLQE